MDFIYPVLRINVPHEQKLVYQNNDLFLEPLFNKGNFDLDNPKFALLWLILRENKFVFVTRELYAKVETMKGSEYILKDFGKVINELVEEMYLSPVFSPNEYKETF